jgi:hypothetical protein
VREYANMDKETGEYYVWNMEFGWYRPYEVARYKTLKELRKKHPSAMVTERVMEYEREHGTKDS